MSEVRRDALTGTWVVYAPARQGRPHDSGAPAAPAAAVPRHDAHCILCPGNEAALPGIAFEMPAPGAGPWRTRAVPNKYPIVDAGEAPARADDGEAPPALHGHHEVIVESPRHDIDLPDMDAVDIAAVVETWRHRFAALAAMPGIATVILFRNRGPAAGASLVHPHSQIVACSAVPPAVAGRQRIAAAHFAEAGECLLCATLARERDEGTRLVAETEGFLAWVPFAARTPCEMIVAPRAHDGAFDRLDAASAAAFARLLREVLVRLRRLGSIPDYNLLLAAPPRGAAPAHAHWFLSVLPRHEFRGGFEFAAGIEVNPSRPEADAARLRGG